MSRLKVGSQWLWSQFRVGAAGCIITKTSKKALVCGVIIKHQRVLRRCFGKAVVVGNPGRGDQINCPLSLFKDISGNKNNLTNSVSICRHDIRQQNASKRMANKYEIVKILAIYEEIHRRHI